MTLKDEWDRLDSETRKWLLDNPGCVLLPRTISAAIRKEAAGHIECDQHGQMMLSQQDQDFIRETANGTGPLTGTGEYRFFDSTQP